MSLQLFGKRKSSRHEQEGLATAPLSVEEFRDRIRTLELLQEAVEEMRLAALQHIDDQDEASRRRFERAHGAARLRADAMGDPHIRSKALYAVHESGHVLNPLETGAAGGDRDGLVDELSEAIAAAQAVIGQRFRALVYGETEE